MRIIILGAGQVGGTLARNLACEGNDVTLVDLNEQRLRELQHRIDIQTVHGSAAHPPILIAAGIEQADMLIAVTDSDEINMIGCQIAYSLFRTPMKIARIRSENYYNYPQLFQNTHIPVDVCISPEKLVTEHIHHLIDYPGATQVFRFADNKLFFLVIKLQNNSPLSAQSLATLYQHINPDLAKLTAIFRNDQSIEPTNQSLLLANDLLLFATNQSAIQSILAALGQRTSPNQRIIIAGGGHIGTTLAQALENSYRIKIIEHNTGRASFLASHLQRGTVLLGDAGDRDLLVNENIEFTDVFCAVTNDDEANIMSCLQAKRLGARHTIALINRQAYVDLIEDSTIDQAVSPPQITIGLILAKLRGGSIVKIHRLQHNEAEIMELVALGDEETSQVVGQRLDALSLPPSCSIAAILRGDTLLIAKPEHILQTHDHVILLLLKTEYARQVELLFQVKLSFMN